MTVIPVTLQELSLHDSFPLIVFSRILSVEPLNILCVNILNYKLTAVSLMEPECPTDKLLYIIR